MIKKYLIDLNVLSVLLNSKDGTILNENYNKLMIGVQKVIESTINEFLTQKGLESFKFNAISNLPDDQMLGWVSATRTKYFLLHDQSIDWLNLYFDKIKI